MVFGESGYSPRPDETLKKSELLQAQAIVGQEDEHALLPPTLQENDLVKIPLDQIQYLFARRYEIFTKLLEKRNGGGVEG